MLRAVRTEAARWQKTMSPDSLHDLRVSGRRYRTALRLFRPLLSPLAAKAIDDRLRLLALASGPARDRDVADALAAQDPACPIGTQHRRLRRFLAGREFRRLTRDAEAQNLALRALHPRCAPDFQSLVARRLSAQYGKLVSLHPLRHLDEADYLHRCRKVARRLRYTAESAAPMRGKGMRDFAALLHPLTTALGNLHDLDVAAHLRRHTMHGWMKAARARHVKLTRAAWKCVAGREGRRLLRLAKAGAKGG